MGVAASDELGMIASPVESVDLKRDGFDRLIAVTRRYEPVAIIVGLPINMSGTEGSQAADVRRFAARLEEAVDIPLIFWDERLTTFMAERTLAETGHRARAQRRRVDAAAAPLILQSYLDSLR